MKRALISLLILGMAGSAVVAQEAAPASQQANQEAYLELLKSDLRTQKVAIVTEAMQMTDADSAIFWPNHCWADAFGAKFSTKREDKNMNCAMPIKSVSPDKKRDNIFFREITKEYRRLSIQTDSEEKIQEILLLFLSKCVDPIDILVKVRSGEYTKEDEIIWKYYLGSSYRKELLQEITKFHNSIYHDGNFQFLVKNPKTQEYLCLDDHGILFLYMDNIEEIMNLINGFLEVSSFSEYITGGSHWHYSFKDAEKYLEELIKQLKLTEG